VGTPNRRTSTVEEKLAALGCDPIEGMAKIAMDPSTDVPLRVQILKELAQYVAPKRKAIEMSGSGGMTLKELVMGSYALDPEQQKLDAPA
jgi:hypothetical protein